MSKLKLSNYSTTAAMNGSIVSANYGLKTVVDQHSLDIAARITPLEVDTKVANAFVGAVSAAALASKLASRDASIAGLQASKADASALTAYALLSEVDSKIAAALLNAVATAALNAALAGKADASALASLLSPPCRCYMGCLGSFSEGLFSKVVGTSAHVGC